MIQNQLPVSTRRAVGQGSQRERRPGVWEIRIRVGADPVTGRSRYRSVTVRGDVTEASNRRQELLAEQREIGLAGGGWATLDGLLAGWLAADQPWRPSTYVGYRSVARALTTDPLGRVRVAELTPHRVRAAVERWQRDGLSAAVIGGRFRVLRAALGWAYNERILDTQPLRHLRGPGRPHPRRPLNDDEVRSLLMAAETRLLEAVANDTGTPTAQARRHRAEQDLLLVRLAADSGARRGELAALRIDDLTGSTLRIDRAVSAGQLTTPKSGHGRCLTIGPTTMALWQRLTADWETRQPDALGPWLFSSDAAHQGRVGAEVLGHRFMLVRSAADVPDATLHRLRHSVATFLVSRGQVLQAQARLGHADAATTLREYAYALPLTDQAVADDIDQHLEPHTDNAEGVRRPG